MAGITLLFAQFCQLFTNLNQLLLKCSLVFHKRKFYAFRLKYYALKVYNLEVNKNDFGKIESVFTFITRFPAGVDNKYFINNQKLYGNIRFKIFQSIGITTN
jgi:hypothetical protein